jgi:hypothetical protein
VLPAARDAKPAPQSQTDRVCRLCLRRRFRVAAREAGRSLHLCVLCGLCVQDVVFFVIFVLLRAFVVKAGYQF